MPVPATDRPPAAGSALSTHLDSRTAATEIAHVLHDEVGTGCAMAVVFASFHHTAALREAVDTIRQTIDPRTVMAVSTEAVLGADHECETGPGMSAIAMHMPGARLRPWVTTLEQPLPLDDPSALAARIGVGDDFRAAIVVGEPFSAKMTNILPALSTCGGGRPVPVFGGMASGASQPGHNLLLLDDDEVRAGAIGVSLCGDIDVDVVVSQGSRSIGEPIAVTALEANVITELGGRAPMQILKEVAETLDEPDRELLNRGLLIGVALDESKSHLGRGDFLIRNVIALNPKDGSMAVGEVPRLGQLIQFHIRDAITADEDLRLLLDAQMMSERPFAGLLFTCNGRGRRLFPEPDHDVSVVRERLGPLPLAGFFAAGEIGPIGSRSFLHGHTAVLGLLRKRAVNG